MSQRRGARVLDWLLRFVDGSLPRSASPADKPDLDPHMKPLTDSYRPDDRRRWAQP